jgi:hypothetical protein
MNREQALAFANAIVNEWLDTAEEQPGLPGRRVEAPHTG